MSATKTVGIVGARGHTGAELIRLITRHPFLALALVSSRELDGERVSDHVDDFDGEGAALERMKALRGEGLSFEAIAAVLTKEGIRTRYEGAWQARVVNRILARA